MSAAETLSPLFVQVFLTFCLLGLLSVVRARAILSKAVTMKQTALTKEHWPDYAKKVSNSFQNQFEMPLFFYLIVVLALVTQKNDFLFVLLSWIFVGSRIAHVLAHTTINSVPARFGVFSIGIVALLTMWALFMLKILFPLAA